MKDDSGLSFAELMVVVALMGIVMAAAYMILGAVQTMAGKTIARAEAMDQAQLFVDRSSREFREALEASESAGVFVTIQPRRVVFYSDVNHDTVPERVTYYVSGNNILRTMASSTDSMTPYTHFTGESTPQTLVTALDPGWAGALFTYYDTNNTSQTATSTIPTLSRVDVKIQTKSTSGRESAVTSMGISARIRSVQNDLGN